MEIIQIGDPNDEESISVQVIDLKKLIDKVIKNPYNYIFRISTSELERLKNYLDKLKNKIIEIDSFTKGNESDCILALALIVFSPAYNESMKPYVIAVTPQGVIFFIKRGEQLARTAEINKILADNKKNYKRVSMSN